MRNLEIKLQDKYVFIAFILLLVGGVNLGLFGLLGINILGLFGLILMRLIFLVIGVASGYIIYLLFIKKDSTTTTL